MKLIKCIFVLFCFCVCLVCVSSMVAEKVTVKVFDYILTPYNSFVRVMIGGQEQMGNILLDLGLMFVGVFVYCAVSVGDCNAIVHGIVQGFVVVVEKA